MVFKVKKDILLLGVILLVNIMLYGVSLKIWRILAVQICCRDCLVSPYIT